MNTQPSRAEIYGLAVRMLTLWGWVRLRLALRIRTSRELWRTWYDLLSRLTERIFGELRFMNYGYLPTGASATARGLEEDACQINLVRFTATADSDQFAKEDLLEVGCGRGGGAAWMARHLDIERVMAIDISEENIRACRRAFADIPGLRFEVGDAENIPFASGSFDRIVNIESSHCYPNFPMFLKEAHRVLRPGGTLRIVDFRLIDRLPEWERDLAAGPLEIVEREEITAAVVRALEADHNRKVATIASSGAPPFMHKMLRQFTGCRGSDIHRSLVEGRRRYWKFVLRRRA